MHEMTPEKLKAFAAAQGWAVAEDRIPELIAICNGIAVDTRPVRQFNVEPWPPAPVFKAD